MMKEEMQNKLDFYLEAFQAAKRHVNNDQVAAIIVQELAKDARMVQQRNHEPSQTESATSKQIEYLKKLGVTIPIGLTKQGASGLIDTALAREDSRARVSRVAPRFSRPGARSRLRAEGVCG